jgi:hypothetical protein
VFATIAATLGLFAAASAVAASPGSYSLITPYDEPGTETTVTGVNDAEYMTGNVADAAGNGPAFIRDPSGDYTTFDNPRLPTTQAGGINNENEVTANDLGPNHITRRSVEYVRDSSGVLKTLRYPKTAAKLHGTPRGLNDHGTIVGNYWKNKAGNFEREGYIKKGSHFVSLDLGLDTTAQGVNNHGKVVGTVEVSPGVKTGFVFDKGLVVFIKDPSAGQGGSTSLESINDHGLAVGEWQSAAGDVHPFEYRLGSQTFTDLTPPMSPTGTNFAALSVNNGGDVILNNGAGTNYLYRPFHVMGGVPEPGAWTVMLLGMAALGARLRRRRSIAT